MDISAVCELFLTVSCDVIVLLNDQGTVIGKINGYWDRIGEGHFWVTRGRVNSQGKAVVNSGSQ